VASKGIPGDAKCVTKIHGGTKIRKLRGNTSSMLPLGHPVPQFDVSVPEKLLKIVATRG